MLKTIIFLSVIIKLSVGDNDILGEDIGENDITMDLDLFETLSTCDIDQSDELTDIESEVQRRCLLIKSKRKCLQATSPKSPGGIVLNRKPNLGNDGPGECVYIPNKKNIIARKLGNQCVAPAAVKKMIRKLRRRPTTSSPTTTAPGTTSLTPPPPAIKGARILSKNGMLNDGEQQIFNMNYGVIATMAIIGLLIGIVVYYKYYRNNNEKEIQIISGQSTSTYQSV